MFMVITDIRCNVEQKLRAMEFKYDDKWVHASPRE